MYFLIINVLNHRFELFIMDKLRNTCIINKLIIIIVGSVLQL